MKTTPFTAIGVDIGGTKIAAAVVTWPDGAIRERHEIPTECPRSGEAILADVEQLVRSLARSKINGIGLALCEIVDRSGKIASANCIPWTGLPVRERLSLIAPTVIEADVRAAALAEALLGAGRDAEVFLYLSIGTGISSCLMINGEPFHGARGAPGTMASGPLPAFCESASIKPMPTLEQIASGPALVSRFHDLGGNANSGQEVLAAAAAGEPRAIRVVASAAEALGGTIGWLVNVLDPNRVILGGGLGLAEGLYRDRLLNSARRHIWWDGHRDLPITSATTGQNAGILGAAAAVWRAAC